ncbi:hypothetical protein COT78_01050 [Candidatus Berkelbacteria bacterium CG10_big_fil_rev_8_21_14_0_10_43_13]|uniref:Glycosyl hydrolase family 32 N-terminal domain-containing protein n=1 Tax=Candidatus Berkelbacteria bacterium CG10_big_fil_rev_8_21_14_0_10_43_13 TaxID=1974514 RepID=A0A2H0W759_9BACT|nr:MAG: hypothetical protein COT78_01050 [Candidatus Berkelbacteria bacterium CG10_big_fil_rev_8_21_14_0_10_43_13]
MDEQQTKRPDESRGSKAALVVSIIVILLILVAGIYYFVNKNKKVETSSSTSSTTGNTASTSEKSTETKEVWQDGQVAVAGNFADAEIADLGGGQFRMYYSVEPEVPNNKLEVYSAISTDGQTWTKESGERKKMATFPDVIKLPDGTWRMYFQNAGVIKSAISADGLNWTDEPGTRVDKTESGFDLENVGAQSTTILADGSFVMIYRGAINEPYTAGGKVPNSTTDIYFWATSKDGLTWQKQGLAIDSRDSILLGMADGAEWVNWDSSMASTGSPQASSGQAELRVYFWSYTGIYHTVFANNTFSAPVFDFTNNKDANIKFSPNPPGDPTLAKIKGTWYMYYGQHTKGIYYATLQ